MTDNPDIQFELNPLQDKHAREVAALHIAGISTGFISSLGADFVSALYEGIAQSESAFGFVVQQEEKVCGFVAFSTNLGPLYRSIILKKGWRFAFILARKMLSWRRIKKVFETLAYPGRVKKMSLPDAELLSIVVSQDCRGKGLAHRLIDSGLQECKKRGIDSVKVMVGAANEPANKLYQKCGFAPAGQIDSHGVSSNIYIARTNQT